MTERERLGRVVRATWVARQKGKPEPSKRRVAEINKTWEELTAYERETDEAIAAAVLAAAGCDPAWPTRERPNP